MDRRAFLGTLAGSMLAAPVAGGAEQIGRPPHIGWLTESVIHTSNVDAFRQGMRSLGYAEVSLDFRGAAGRADRLPALAAELLALGVDVIVTDGTPAAFAAKQATAKVPIVAGTMGGDVIRLGLVASLAHPGSNITGFTLTT